MNRNLYSLLNHIFQFSFLSCPKPTKIRNAMENLEKWFMKYPELFNQETIKKMSQVCLANMISYIYCKANRESYHVFVSDYDKQFADYLKATCCKKIPTNIEPGRISNWLEDHSFKWDLEEVVWKYYKGRIDARAYKKRI